MADFVQIEKQLKNAIENLDHGDVQKRQEAIHTFPRLLQVENYTVVEAVQVKEMIEPCMQKLIEMLRNEKDISVRKSIANALGGMNVFPEVFPELLEIFKLGIEEKNLSGEVGKKLLKFPNSYPDIKVAILEMLQSQEVYHKQLGLGMIRELWKTSEKVGQKRNIPEKVLRRNLKQLEWKIQTEILPEDERRRIIREIEGLQEPHDDGFFKEQLEKDWLQIVRNLTREKKIETQAMALVTLSQITPDINFEIKSLQKEVTYNIVYDLLNKFQQNIQVPLTRIKELTTPLIEEQMGIYKKYISIPGVKWDFPKELFEEVIIEIVRNGDLSGEYFELEQVFVRKKGKETYSLTSSTISKNYICYYCGNPIEREDKVCQNCKKEILKCNVCKLPISFGEEAGKCSLCEAKGHMSHLQEWIKIKGKCPTCQKKLPIEGIVSLSSDWKK